MRTLRGWLKRLSGIFRKDHRDHDLSAEMETHLAMHVEDNLRAGMNQQSARREALMKLGGVEQTKELYRERRSLPVLEVLFQDLGFALRTLRKNPGFAAVAVLTLALGIGANTAMFSLVNGVLLRPLPYADPDCLVGATNYYPKGPFVVMRERSRTMDMAANTDGTDFNLSGVGVDTPVRITGASVSANWFSILGVTPESGRVFRTGEDQPGNNALVILSHSLWQRRFGGDPGIIGRSIMLDGESREVVGIMPPNFRVPSPKTELWVPLQLDIRDIGDYWGSSYMPIVARLRPGVSLEQARHELAGLRPQIFAAYAWPMPNDAWAKSTLLPLHELMVGDVRPKLVILLGAVGLLLLIGCANVANLLLARATTRQKEIALRTALGAGRWRIVRQLITESLLLSILGAALGLSMAFYGLAALKSTLPADTPRISDVAVDARVLAFTATLALLTGLLFGAMPAAGASRVDLTKALKTGGEKSGAAKGHGFSRSLIIGEVAIAAILVIGAGLLVKSLWKLSTANPGFQQDYILTARITPNQSFCEVPGRCQSFYRDLLMRVRALPGVKGVSTADGLPLSGIWETIPSDIEGFTVSPGAHGPMLMERVVTPDYLHIMQIPLLQGRGFTEADTADSSQRVALITKSTAEHFWPGQNAMGKHFKPRWLKDWWTIVGIVGDVREASLTQNVPDWIDGEMYIPFGPHAVAGRGPERAPAEMTLLLRTSDEALLTGGTLQSVVAELNRDVPVSQVQTLSGWVSDAVAGPRSIASIFSIFAALALTLGAVGIYGVISYSVAQRTREIGIRIALGARRPEVLLLILRQSALLALAGIGIGLVGAFFLTRLMASLLYGVSAADPATYFAVSVLLIAVALAASYLPARRAMRVDPVVALRYE